MQELYVKRNPLYFYFLLVQDGKRPHKPFHNYLYANPLNKTSIIIYHHLC